MFYWYTVFVVQSIHVPYTGVFLFRSVLYAVYLIISHLCYTGDAVYFEFTVDSGGGNTSWGYKFTVTAGTRDSFQTGYVILGNVLSTDLAL